MTAAAQKPPTREQLDKALADAVRLGNIVRATDLIEQYDCDPNVRVTGHPLLSLAVRLKLPKMAEMLLEKGAEVNATDTKGDSALMLAARLCKEDFMSMILLHGGGLQQKSLAGETAESIALKGLADARAAELKVEYDRDRPAAQEAVDKWLKLALAMLATNPDPDARVDGHPAITLAVLMAKPDDMIKLMERGADLNAANPDGDTALMLSARACKPDFIAALMDKGADPMLANHAQETAAMIALNTAVVYQAREPGGYDFQRKPKVELTNKWEEFALSLVAHPAYDPKAEAGNSSLTSAICLKNPAAFETLLLKGADINAPDTHGNCALHAAAATGKGAIVDKLLGMGASLLQQNKDKERPLDLFNHAYEQVPHALKAQQENKEISPEEAAARLDGWKKLQAFLTEATEREVDSLEAPLTQTLTVRNKPLKLKMAKTP